MSTHQFYRDILQLQDETLIQTLVSLTKWRYLTKGQCILHAGDQMDELCFLDEGCIMGSSTNDEGEFYVDCIENKPGTACVDVRALNNGFVSTLNIEMLTCGAVFSVPLTELMELVAQNPEANRVYVDLLERAVIRNWNLRKVLTTCDAMGRYRWFLSEYPGLEQQISGKLIASYLSITSVTLSRLRRILKAEEESDGETDREEAE